MLFLNTLDVEAANITQSFSGRFIISSSGGGSFGSSSSIHPVGQGTYHVEMPFTFIEPLSGYSVTQDYNKYYDVYFNSFDQSFIYPSYGGFNYSNLCVKDYQGNILWTNNNPSYSHRTYSGSEILIDNKLLFPFTMSFDVKMTTASPDNGYQGGMDFKVDIGLYESGYMASGQPVYDSSAHQDAQTQINQNTQAEQTRSGILAKITEFFGSFFSNLIGVFVPEDGYFSSWFTRLNTLLADKLGMLYAPFDLLIQVLTSILNSDDSFAGIPFPGIEWDGQYLVEPFTFTFSSLGDVYTDLQGYVYFGTDVILLLAFFGLLQDKIKHILED